MNCQRHTRRIALCCAAGLLLLAALALSESIPSDQDWTHYVRIGAYGLGKESVDKIVADATASKVFGIEVDNDIPGRYESFLDPTEKLKAIRELAERAHRAGNHAFVYIAGTECITANAAQTQHTLAKEHPDWLQRNITGNPAVFGGGTAFWIKKGDEDVWISPYAPEWRKIYMERVRQIAATGIDGIYIDIPYWMTHFDGWEDSWASFDDYTVATFKKRTGLDARHDVKVGDFSDPNFRKWVDFRIDTITDFLRDIDQNAKAVNPQIKTIPEIYPGIEEEATRVGADVYSLYPVVDAIAHEYEFGNGNHMASGRTPLDWFRYQVGMHSFRAFAQGKATWILNYSWDGDKNVAARDAMPNLAMSQIMDGANFWDAPGHSMAGSNDLPTRKKIFEWIEKHQATFYRPRQPIQPVGVYFSPKTRDYGAKDFIASYRGCLILLMQTHREFQVVTPRTLAEFKGEVLILPDVREMSEVERGVLKILAASGTRIIVTGQNGSGLAAGPNLALFPDCPCRRYEKSLDPNLEKADPAQAKDFLAALQHQGEIEITASPLVATSIAMVDGKPHIFLANFDGLRGGSNAVPTPQKGIALRLRTRATVRYLPFLGNPQEIRGLREGDRFVYRLPDVARGGVAWIEK
ncbi:MAG: family 10 glycosylhydrolase [Terriglobales bacterium]